MAENQTGIMALPENQDVQGPTLGLDESYGAVKEALSAARPDAAVEANATMSGIRGFADDLTDEQLDSMLQLIQYLYSNKDNYKQLISDLVKEGYVDEGDMPAEYDPEFLSTFGTVLLEERKSRGSDRPPFPEKFARGGIAEAARIVANQGRSGDTMLAHINAEEARMLRKMGGVGTINPVTGLPEFAWYSFITKPFKAVAGLVKSAFKTVVNTVKKILASPIGRIIATVALTAFLGPGALGFTGLGLSAGVAAATAAGTISIASGGNIKDAVKAAAFSYFTTPSMPANPATGAEAFVNPVHDWVGNTTQQFAGANNFVASALENSYVKNAVVGFGTSTAAGLLTGQKLEDAVKGGLTNAAITTGVSAVNNNLSGFNNNAKAGAEVVDGINAEQGTSPAAAMSGVPNNVKNNISSVSMPNGDGTFTVTQVDTFNRPISTTTVDSAGNAIGSSGSSAAAMANPNAGAGPGNLPTLPLSTDAAARALSASSAPVVPPVAAPAAAPYAVPTATTEFGTGIGGSLKQIGSGVADIAQGNFSQGYKDIVGGGGNLFFPSGPTPEQIQGIEAKYGVGSNAAKAAIDQASPGTFRTYAPAAAAGLGIAALSGAFKQDEPPPSELGQQLAGTPGEDLIAKNPDNYIVQNIPGIQYDANGNVIQKQNINVSPSSYNASMGDVTVPTNSSYQTASYPTMQNPSQPMMDPYQYYYQQYLASAQQPRQYAMGGITSLSDSPNGMPSNMGNYSGGITGLPTQQSTMMSSTAPSMGMGNLTEVASRRDGGTANYPRRVGQISGPGTEKSDSIPAMLSDGEFVMTSAAVRGMGAGSRREGAKRMYALMHQLERNAARG